MNVIKTNIDYLTINTNIANVIMVFMMIKVSNNAKNAIIPAVLAIKKKPNFV